MVSILTQPLGWVQPLLGDAWLVDIDVSILTQPLGWVQRHSNICDIGRHLLFQSSPNLSAGCSEWVWVIEGREKVVSILTQPLGWVQPVMAGNWGVVNVGFQSSPNLSAGCSANC